MNIVEFITSLNQNDAILTANRRLSTYLRKQYDQHQLNQGLNCWPSLAIMPLSSWVEQTFNAYEQDHCFILNDFQELLLWEEVIANSAANDGLMNTTATANLVKESFHLLQNFGLTLEEISTYPSQDVQTFVSWCQQFQQKCAEMKAISRCEILPLLIQQLKNKTSSITLPSKFFLLGFDDLSPRLKELAELLKMQTIEIQHTDKAAISRTSFFDREQEIMAMARWAYEQHHNDPTAKIGCIVPNLERERNSVANYFEEIAKAQQRQQDLFNISAANSLLYYPIIRHALLILKMNFIDVDFDLFSQLLRSPFIAGGQTEQHSRALLDAALRQQSEHKINIKNINVANRCHIFYSHLQDFIQSTIDQEQTLEQWAHTFAQQLRNMGWPGEVSLNSAEFQIVERFKKCFDEFVTMHVHQIPCTLTTAYNLFHYLISKIAFQPESVDTPIQILGMLEGSGLQFDLLWVAGLNNENWPQPPSPNPFIPIAVQKKYDMPHATSERELQFSSTIMKRLQYNAHKLILSYAEHDNDRPLEPSSLISKYPQCDLSLEPYYSIEQQLYQTKKLEYLCDEYGPPIIDHTISGGTGIFKSQAACPFQAFAKYRLGATPLEEAQIGLAADERGSLIHEILALAWNEIKDHQSLCAINNQQLDHVILTSINTALQNLKSEKPYTLKKRFLEIETKRLHKIVAEWFNYEKQRESFEVISCEQRQTAQIGQLQIHIQIDRIDRLSSGNHLIIDYKTGRPSVLDWFSNRPKEPQLPLYSVLSEHEIAGILFAQLRPGELCFKGLAAYGDIAPGTVTLDRFNDLDYQSWPELLTFWQQTLLTLADDFSSGKASVDPKNPATCVYCDLHEFCRVNHPRILE